MKKVLLFITLFFIPIIYAKNIVQISIPKAGTNLLQKCISSLTGMHPVTWIINWKDPIELFIVDPKKFNHVSQNAKHWKNHLFFNKDFEPYLNSDKNAFFFIYRDPRDQIVSLAYFMRGSEYYKRVYWPRAKKFLLMNYLWNL